jgi:putative solute:sodium symporter small subunit
MTEGADNSNESNHANYWKANIKVLIILIAAWFFVSFGLSILAVEWLDQFQILGFPLGFWMAQQGSIVAFLVIIAVYVVVMNRLDKKHGVEEEEPDSREFEI